MKSTIISTTADSISSGGSITGDLTISGDLTVSGGGSFTYEEVIDGSLGINDYIYHNDDTNTYIGFPALDTFRVRTGGTNRLILDNNSRISLSNNDGNDYNTVFGYHALTNAGTVLGDVGADQNTAIGHLAMGTGTTLAATDNTAVGYKALEDITIGDFNTGIGVHSLGNITDAIRNTAVGYDSLATNVSGNYNTAIGMHSLYSNLTHNNTALGYESGTYTTGADNTYVGYNAGRGSSGAEANNVAVGSNALLLVTTGSDNTVMGSVAGDSITTGHDNVFMGRHAGGATQDVGHAVIIGQGAGGGVITAAADGTVAIGASSLAVLTSGAGNVAVGYQSLDATATGASNTMVGYQSGTALVDGSDNNTAVGYQAMLGGNNDVTHKNTVVGYQAGMQISNGFNNTLIGANVDVNTGSFDNVTAIGNNFEASQDDTVFLGNNDTEEVWMALDKGATVYCDKIAVGAGITQHSTTHLDVEGSIRAGCGSGDSGSTQAGQLMGLAGTTEGDNTVRLLKASMTSEGSLWVVSGYQGGTANRFVDLLLAYSGGVAVVSAQNTNSPDTRTYSIVAEALKLLINVTDSGEETYHIRMTGIGGNELAASTAPTMGGA